MVIWILTSSPSLSAHSKYLIFFQEPVLNCHLMTMLSITLHSFWPCWSFQVDYSPLSLTISFIMVSTWSNSVLSYSLVIRSSIANCLSRFPFLQESFSVFLFELLSRFTSRESSVINSSPSFHGSFYPSHLEQFLQYMSYITEDAALLWLGLFLFNV